MGGPPAQVVAMSGGGGLWGWDYVLLFCGRPKPLAHDKLGGCKAVGATADYPFPLLPRRFPV